MLKRVRSKKRHAGLLPGVGVMYRQSLPTQSGLSIPALTARRCKLFFVGFLERINVAHVAHLGSLQATQKFAGQS